MGRSLTDRLTRLFWKTWPGQWNSTGTSDLSKPFRPCHTAGACLRSTTQQVGVNSTYDWSPKWWSLLYPQSGDPLFGTQLCSESQAWIKAVVKEVGLITLIFGSHQAVVHRVKSLHVYQRLDRRSLTWNAYSVDVEFAKESQSNLHRSGEMGHDTRVRNRCIR